MMDNVAQSHRTFAKCSRYIQPTIPIESAVCHPSPFCLESPPLGRTFRQIFQPEMIEILDEIIAPMGEIREKKGMSGIRLD